MLNSQVTIQNPYKHKNQNLILVRSLIKDYILLVVSVNPCNYSILSLFQNSGYIIYAVSKNF
jgi:hypothetical protein